MNDHSAEKFDIWEVPAARTYALIGLVAAFAMGLTLMQYADSVWAIAPTLIGIVGLLFRWMSAPAFMLLGIALSLLIAPPEFAIHPTPASDALLAGSVVAVMLAHFRLYAITTAIFPTEIRRTLDPSRVSPKGPPVWVEILMVLTIIPYIVHMLRQGKSKRRPLQVSERRESPLTTDEWPLAVGVVALCATASVALWAATARIQPPLRTIIEQWRLGLMIWFALLAVFIPAIVIGYRHARRRTAIEARLILNDELWRETRGDQRRIARWLDWSRRKRQNKLLEQST